MLGEGKLASKFRSSSGTNNFMKSGQLEKNDNLEIVFEDSKKNMRYWDYVH